MRTPQRRFELIRRYVLGVSLVAPLFFAQVAQSQAYLVQTNVNGDATGILGMSVPGETQLFNMDFVFGSHAGIFGITNGVFANAAALRDATITELNTTTATNGLFPPVIFDPSSSFTVSSFFRIPLSSDLVSYVNYVEGLCTLTAGACSTFYAPGPSFAITVNANTLWAVPTAVVPLPAALPLFGSALAMLGIVGWRRKRRGAA